MPIKVYVRRLKLLFANRYLFGDCDMYSDPEYAAYQMNQARKAKK
jgi:hypothetical protein